MASIPKYSRFQEQLVSFIYLSISFRGTSLHLMGSSIQGGKTDRSLVFFGLFHSSLAHWVCSFLQLVPFWLGFVVGLLVTTGLWIVPFEFGLWDFRISEVGSVGTVRSRVECEIEWWDIRSVRSVVWHSECEIGWDTGLTRSLRSDVGMWKSALRAFCLAMVPVANAMCLCVTSRYVCDSIRFFLKFLLRAALRAILPCAGKCTSYLCWVLWPCHYVCLRYVALCSHIGTRWLRWVLTASYEPTLPLLPSK